MTAPLCSPKGLRSVTRCTMHAGGSVGRDECHMPRLSKQQPLLSTRVCHPHLQLDSFCSKAPVDHRAVRGREECSMHAAVLRVNLLFARDLQRPVNVKTRDLSRQNARVRRKECMQLSLAPECVLSAGDAPIWPSSQARRRGRVCGCWSRARIRSGGSGSNPARLLVSADSGLYSRALGCK